MTIAGNSNLYYTLSMEKQIKLYVFNRNEIILIFAFMVLIAITSFVLGVKIGKSYSYEQAGLTPEDSQRVELLSNQEEAVNQVTEKMQDVEPAEKKEILDQSYKSLEKEFNQLEEKKAIAPEQDVIEAHKTDKAQDSAEMAIAATPAPSAKDNSAATDDYSGKYTIQLGSHRSLEDAERFAEGFKVRGYDPVIINQVEIAGKGTWYRVSLGVFDSLPDVKQFIMKEQSLLKGTDYVIAKFQ